MFRLRPAFAGLLLLLLVLAVPARVARAANDSVTLDSLRAGLELAMANEDEAAAVPRIVAILRQHPGDGRALTCIGLLPSSRLAGVQALGRRLQPGPWPDARGAVLAPADVELVLAMLGNVTSYYRTATEHTDRALKLRPGWGWARAMRGRIGVNACAPIAGVRADLAAGLADAEAGPYLAAWLAYSAFLGEGAARGMDPDSLLARVPPDRWGTANRSSLRFYELLMNGGVRSVATCDSSCRAAFAEAGMLDPELVDDVAQALRALPFEDEMAFLRARTLDRPAREHWRRMLVRACTSAGLATQADSVANGASRALPEILQARVLSLGERGRRDAALAAADSLVAMSLDREFVISAQNAYTMFDDRGRQATLASLQRTENPVQLVQDDLPGRMSGDPVHATAVLDSLDRELDSPNWVRSSRLEMQELRGDLLPIERIPGNSPAVRATMMRWLASVDGGMGRLDRARALRAEADRLAPTLRNEWTQLFAECLQRRDARALAEQFRAADAKGQLGPQELDDALWRARTLLDRALVETILERALRGPGSREPGFLASYAAAALFLDRAAQADSLIAAARVRGAGTRAVEAQQAVLWHAKGDRVRALDRLGQLAKTWPGDAWLASLSLASSDQAAPSQDVERTHDEENFRGFSFDMADTTGLARLAATSDTCRMGDFVFLRYQNQYACEFGDRVQERRHFVIRLLTEDGVASFASYRLPFSPLEGAPVVIWARVRHPDGRVVDVRASDMLVSSANEDASDVTDQRAIVIPFPGLKRGSVVDLCWSQANVASIGANVSFRCVMNAEATLLDGDAEVRVRKGREMHLVRGGGLGEPVTRENADWTYTRWRVTNPPPIEAEDHSPSLFETNPWFGGTTAGSWEDAAESYRRAFWNRVAADDTLKRVALALVRGAKTPGARLDSLYRHVSQDLRYLAIEIAGGRVLPTLPNEVERRGFGDCKDKSALLVALARSLGYTAWPVLARSRATRPIRADFVEVENFNHMIVCVRGPDGDHFCDPTTGGTCSGVLPLGLQGTPALVLPDDRPAYECLLPADSSRAHGYHMTMDVRPGADGLAKWNVVARLRGQPAEDFAGQLQDADSADVTKLVTRLLGYGVPRHRRLVSWRLDGRWCGGMQCSATFEDSSWGGDTNTRQLFVSSEVADLFMEFPDPQGRRADVQLLYPLSDTVIVRLHATPGWEIGGDVAPLRVDGARWGGAIEGGVVTAGSDRWLEVRQRFDIRSSRLTAAEFTRFHHDWRTFGAGVDQPYRLTRSVDRRRLATLQHYVDEHPDDANFIVQGAYQLLGRDFGGDGPAGEERRHVTETWLRDVLVRQPDQLMAALVLAGAYARDGHYRRADSLLDALPDAQKSEVIVLGVRYQLKKQLGDSVAVRALFRRAERFGSGDQMALERVTLLAQYGTPAEAEEAAERYQTLAADPDTAAMYLTLILGYSATGHCDEARSILARFRALPDTSQVGLAAAGLAMDCGPLRASISEYEKLWESDPMAAGICNNLAWAYALVGENLERAEMLARTAVALEDDGSSARNTLALIQMRTGRWVQATAYLRQLLEEDDRPGNVTANRFLLGICEHHAGRIDAARALWTSALASGEASRWTRILQHALQLSQAGDDPMKCVNETEMLF